MACQSVCRFVCWSITVVSPAKTAELIEMLFRLWALVGSRNHVLDVVQIAPCGGAIFRGKDMPGHARQHSAVSCAKIAEPIDMPFRLWTSMGPIKYVLHASANWCSLGNTIEPSVCNSDAAAFLSNYFNHLLWPPCVADADIIFLPCGFYLSFFSLPNLSTCRLYVYHTSTHDVALVQI